MDTCISMESVGIPNPSRGHIPHMFFIHSCRTPMPHSHSHVLACQPHSHAMTWQTYFPQLKLGFSHSDIPNMFPTGAWGFPWSKIRTIIGCMSNISTKHWGFPVWHSMDDSHHGNHAWLPLLECCFPQPKYSIIVYKWMKHPTPVSPAWSANCNWSRPLLAMCTVFLIKLWNLNAMVVQ